MTNQELKDMEEWLLFRSKFLGMTKDTIMCQNISLAIAELKRHRNVLKHVFERARLARLNVYDNRDDAYEYLVEIREKEEALKRGDEILNGEMVRKP